jgi:predicted secreted protein
VNKIILTMAITLLGVCNLGFAADATLQVKAGDSFTISRPENPGSTGYSWSEKIDNESIVEFESKEFESAKKVMPGAPGTAYFHFHASKPGSVTITLELRRPWEVDKAAAKTYTIDVTVS